MVIMPSKPQVSFPAFSVSCKIKNRDQQNRFLQPIRDSDSWKARNSRVFPKVKGVKAVDSILTEVKFLNLYEQSLPDPNFSRANQLKSGARGNSNPNLNYSQNYFSKNPAIFHLPSLQNCNSNKMARLGTTLALIWSLWGGLNAKLQHHSTSVNSYKFLPCLGGIFTERFRRFALLKIKGVTAPLGFPQRFDSVTLWCPSLTISPVLLLPKLTHGSPVFKL